MPIPVSLTLWESFLLSKWTKRVCDIGESPRLRVKRHKFEFWLCYLLMQARWLSFLFCKVGSIRLGQKVSMPLRSRGMRRRGNRDPVSESGQPELKLHFRCMLFGWLAKSLDFSRSRSCRIIADLHGSFPTGNALPWWNHRSVLQSPH